MNIGLSDPATSSTPHRVSICGIDELEGFVDQAVTHVVSILDPDHPGLPVLDRMAGATRLALRFHDVIHETPGAQAPSEADIETILSFGDRTRGEAIGHLLIHCHAGISRSTATAAILLTQWTGGAEQAHFDHINQIRPRSWPNSRMITLADRMLGRQGDMIAAMQSHHHRVARAFPLFADLLRGGARAHEVPGIQNV